MIYMLPQTDNKINTNVIFYNVLLSTDRNCTPTFYVHPVEAHLTYLYPCFNYWRMIVIFFIMIKSLGERMKQLQWLNDEIVECQNKFHGEMVIRRHRFNGATVKL